MIFITTLYNSSAQTVAANGIVQLTTVGNQKGCSTTSGSNAVVINKPGIYQINATVFGLVTGGGTINLGIEANGVAIPYLAGSAYTNTAEPATITLTGTYVVNPNCCAVTTNVPETITLVNNGANSDVLSFASLNVTKIC